MPKGVYDNNQSGQPNYVPSPEQIEAAKAEIQAGWSKGQRMRAASGMRPTPAAIPRYDYGHEGFESKGSV